jgi:hypothetical protein
MKSPLIHLIVWACVCAAALVGYSVWFAAVESKSMAVAALENKIKTKNETSARVTEARAILAKIAEDESLVRGYFVPETKIVSFINALEGLSSEQKTEMKVLSVSTRGDAQHANLELRISASVQGAFDAVMRTVGAIEYAPYHISITKFSVTNGEKDSWSASLELVVGSMPVIKQEADEQAAPLKAPTVTS